MTEGIFLAYNNSMDKIHRNNIIRLILRIVLPIACILWLAFIFSNSLQTAEQSTAQSTTVVDKVQDVAQIVAPQSPIATATGKDYERLHLIIRDLAHFIQFMVLGVLVGWCYFAYTTKLHFFYLPAIVLLIVPIVDEWLQTYSSGRAGEFADVLTDTYGGMAGLAVALLTFFAGFLIYKMKTRDKVAKAE